MDILNENFYQIIRDCYIKGLEALDKIEKAPSDYDMFIYLKKTIFVIYKIANEYRKAALEILSITQTETEDIFYNDITEYLGISMKIEEDMDFLTYHITLPFLLPNKKKLLDSWSISQFIDHVFHRMKKDICKHPDRISKPFIAVINKYNCGIFDRKVKDVDNHELSSIINMLQYYLYEDDRFISLFTENTYDAENYSTEIYICSYENRISLMESLSKKRQNPENSKEGL